MTKALATTDLTPDEPKLSGRRLRFAMEFLFDGNATAAYLRAGYTAKDSNVAAASGSRLLRDAKVKAFIRAEVARQVDDLRALSAARRRRLAEHSTANLADAYNEDGSLKRIQDMPLALQHSISSVEVVELAGGMDIETGKPGSDGAEGGGVRHVALYVKKIKLWDQQKAIELGAKLDGELNEVKVSGTIQHNHTHRLTKEQADAAYRAAGLEPPIEGEKVAA